MFKILFLWIFICLQLVFLHGKERVYNIAAIELDWDYAPTGIDQLSGYPLDKFPEMRTRIGMEAGMKGSHQMTSEQMKGMGHLHSPSLWTVPGPKRIGRIYKKAAYREYMDDEWIYPKQRSRDQDHLGILGPTIYAEVGDTVIVRFKNKASFQCSVHAHGLFYTKIDEGAPYAQNETTITDFKRHPGAPASGGDGVLPGDTFIYKWTVPERAGPGPNDPSSIAWLYHSHTDESADTNSGLVGAIVITRQNSYQEETQP